MNQKKIFVSAYACEPGLGSEIGVGWHWVLEMSKYFELWVLTRESNRARIESWLSEHEEHSGIHFLYYDLPKWARFWKKGLRGVRLYYNMWQIFADGIVKRTMIENDIRIFHHLTYGNMLWRVSRFGQKQYFVWGPVGGLETIPSEYSSRYGVKSRLLEAFRRLVVRMLPLNAGFRRRCGNADLILCKTEITRALIPRKYQQKAVLQTDVAVEHKDVNIDEYTSKYIRKGKVNYLVVGRLDAWRGFDIVIEAFAKASECNDDIHLTIVGNGNDKQRLTGLIKRLHLERKVAMTGALPQHEYEQIMADADVVVNAALKEGAVTVSFDCLAYGKPLICVDTTGYTRYFNNNYSVIVPRTSRFELVQNLADAILKLSDKSVRDAMGLEALKAGERFDWNTRGLEIKIIFSQIVF